MLLNIIPYKAGVALTVISLIKVNQVLMMFGHKLAPVNHKEIEE